MRGLGAIFVGLLLVAVVDVTVGQEPTDDCPFTDGSCPVTMDNVVDVYFHDVADQVSCQRQCQDLEECHFFTMFGTTNDESNHMKCFLFKTCDHLEACPDCTTGPEQPPIDKNNCTYDGNYTCETDLHNIVDVYYFDSVDTFSCKHQCSILDNCNFWTHFEVKHDPHPHHKCFLYKDCTIHEPCTSCETGSKGKFQPLATYTKDGTLLR